MNDDQKVHGKSQYKLVSGTTIESLTSHIRMTANHSAVTVDRMKSVDATVRAVSLPSNKKCLIRHFELDSLLRKCFVSFVLGLLSDVFILQMLHKSTDRIKL